MMDRTGTDWSGDRIAHEAAGESDEGGSRGNRADSRAATEDQAPRRRSVDTAAENGVSMNDDGGTPVTTGGSGATGESD